MEPRISRIDADGQALAALLALTQWVSSAERVRRSQIIESASSASSAVIPIAVSRIYGWAWNPMVNLYNKEGLPAITFRTDE
jgi:hypothetical protein